jgi:hypothetical protein
MVYLSETKEQNTDTGEGTGVRTRKKTGLLDDPVQGGLKRGRPSKKLKRMIMGRKKRFHSFHPLTYRNNLRRRRKRRSLVPLT